MGCGRRGHPHNARRVAEGGIHGVITIFSQIGNAHGLEEIIAMYVSDKGPVPKYIENSSQCLESHLRAELQLPLDPT